MLLESTQIDRKIPILNSAFTTDGRSAVSQSQACINLFEFWSNIYIFNDHIVCGVSCLNITVQLSALHAMLYIEQVVATSSGNVKLEINYHYSLHNNLEDCRSYLLCGRSLKSHLRNGYTVDTSRVK
jgi:uncharacterized protein (DUF608 family)